MAAQALDGRSLFTRLVIAEPKRSQINPRKALCTKPEKMIPRYTRPEMGRIFSDENRFEQWLAVELAASEALAETGEVPAEAARALRQHAAFDVARIHEIEREVKHDVIAFTTAVAEKMAAAGQADASRWLHYGLTSNDVVDTAQALVLQQASAVLEERTAKRCSSR